MKSSYFYNCILFGFLTLAYLFYEQTPRLVSSQVTHTTAPLIRNTMTSWVTALT